MPESARRSRWQTLVTLNHKPSQQSPWATGWRVAFAALVLILLATSAVAQISPGPLARPHQSLNGASNCTTCHKLAAGEATFQCLACHSEIGMVVLDIARVFRIAALRRHALSFGEKLSTLGGLLKTGHRDLERAIAMAREEATTAKRVLFLQRSQQVFHLWHVVHKPFSYTFAILALIHIGVVLSLGFM